MTASEIQEKVIGILVKLPDIAWPEDIETCDKESLFHNLSLSGLDTFYLMLEIQMCFGITIPYLAVAAGFFKSLNSIVGLIQECLNAGSK